jgi:hypothetical protein
VPTLWLVLRVHDCGQLQSSRQNMDCCWCSNCKSRDIMMRLQQVGDRAAAAAAAATVRFSIGIMLLLPAHTALGLFADGCLANWWVPHRWDANMGLECCQISNRCCNMSGFGHVLWIRPCKVRVRVSACLAQGVGGHHGSSRCALQGKLL